MTELAQEKASAAPDETQIPLDIEDLMSETQAKREDSLRKLLEANRKKSTKTVDAAAFALEMGRMDVADFEPVMKWEMDAVTEKQAIYLKRAKIDLATVRGKGHASKLLDLYFGSKKTRLASDKVRGLMKRMGHHNWEKATEAEGRRFMASMGKRKREPSLL